MNNENTVFKSLAIIEENIQEKLTVEKLADDLHFSKYHYQRLFREAVGDTVMRYVTGRKLTLAAADLAETEDSILDIAVRYGYDSHEGFTRSFKGYVGITPKEYRKYYSSVSSPETKADKEKSAMLYSKSTDEMLRKLNGLIVEAKETAEYIRKNKDSNCETAAFYSDFWDYIANKTDAMADTLTEALKPITVIAAQPDEITARFIIIKTIDKAVFQLDTIEFQTGLTISRAKPEHRPILNELGNRIIVLSHSARITYAKTEGFLIELSEMIFGDMRSNASEHINKAVQKGREAVKPLTTLTESYSYIKEGIEEIVNELSFTPIERITADLLEDLVFRLDIIAFSADMDIIRTPSDKPLFDGISEFKKQLSEAADFFRDISEDIISSFDNSNKATVNAKIKRNRYGDMAFRENILLFYLKGEVQKLDKLINNEQKAAFDKIFEEMNTVIRLANHSVFKDGGISLIAEKEIAEYMKDIYSQLTDIINQLGEYGSAVAFIAEEIKHCSICRCVEGGYENCWLF